ncbi:ferrous iron transporter B [Halopseudomonas pelagia]|uniref:Ferrous iron transporter B n=1 Tax=Halopseudomonas pelagia TaxID=553151 RepID=A0AA91U111_9GAMM|nr:ferrous iron transporter B [Halopseudomonas pelagia]PCC98503.1 ferrous iron transporter B [Halopseudomonas pelagia]QFY57475.1 ferrous iron transporter B [Halopseudomonas pelagia]
MGEVEDLLQQFLEDRHNGSLLQQAIEGLQQLRGTLTLIELRGAALLLAEMIALATDIPEHDGTDRNEPLSALCDSLFLLERYLQQCRHQGFERPELLLPTINQLRANRPGVPALSDSHFYSLAAETLPLTLRGQQEQQPLDGRTFNRLRQMYQLGLLGMIRDDGLAASAPLMQRALVRWQSTLDPSAATLCWVAAAALEAIERTPLQLSSPRKRLFSQLDREIKKRAVRQPSPAPTNNPELLRELAFLVALGDATCDRCEEVKAALRLPDPGYTELELQSSFHRLRGPGVDVMRSVAEALREELTAIKDLLDLLARNAGDPEQSLETLGGALQRLWKTLSMLDLPEAAAAIEAAAEQLSSWKSADIEVLEQIADAVLMAETAVNRLDERGSDVGPVPGSVPGDSKEPVELKEARIVLIEESQAGLSLAKRAITAYMESGNDIMHLMNVPSTLETVRGGLIFLGMTRAASIINLSGRFIQEVMLERRDVPKAQQLEVLADALTSIEFYLESAERSAVATTDVLTLAEESLAELGYTLAGP